jgi:hypothetical protein
MTPKNSTRSIFLTRTPRRTSGLTPDQLGQKLEEITRELTLHIMAPNWKEFDGVLESAHAICDRYELKKTA